VRLGVRAQRLSLQAPSVRSGREDGGFALDGTAGWSLLIDAGDEWSAAGPFLVTYGLAVRRGFDGPDAMSMVPRVGGSWTHGRMETRASISYLANAHVGVGADGPGWDDRRSPYGYDVAWKARLDPTTTIRANASYVPSQADVWREDVFRVADTLFVTDGSASDRFIALELERVASPATISFRVARGRVDGALAPAFDDDLPVVLLSDRALDYDAARFGVKSTRAGSAFSLEYRLIRDHEAAPGDPGADAVRSFDLEFAQDLVRFAGGRASCRFLLTARSALRPGSGASATNTADAGRFVAEHQRVGAGVSLAF